MPEKIVALDFDALDTDSIELPAGDTLNSLAAGYATQLSANCGGHCRCFCHCHCHCRCGGDVA